MADKESLATAKALFDGARAAALRLDKYFRKSYGLKLDPGLFSIIFMEEIEKSLGGTQEKAIQVELYLLQNVSAGYVGNSPMFWCEGGGYTQWVSDAKLWTNDEADQQIRSTKGSHSWKKWPLATINKHSRPTVDMQDLRSEAEACREP